MIPKVIHYCWFGGKPLPKSAIKCIESWKNFFPDYEIKEWNESNYDVGKNPYLSMTYEAKKYAFVSDYARFDILYNFGGIYFDTDVEVIKSFEDILENGSFMGCEEESGETFAINPGLGIASEKGLPLYRSVLDFYDSLGEKDREKIVSRGFVVPKTTEILVAKGLKQKREIQCVDGITIYPKEYFNPLDSATGKLSLTEQTRSIHWYTASWLSPTKRLRSKILKPIHRLLGRDFFHRKKD